MRFWIGEKAKKGLNEKNPPGRSLQVSPPEFFLDRQKKTRHRMIDRDHTPEKKTYRGHTALTLPARLNVAMPASPPLVEEI